MTNHLYNITVTWTGNEGKGTLDYNSYSRNHKIFTKGKYDSILSSSDPAFKGDKSRYNPEDLFLSSLSSCHMLWYLHLCTTHKITVTNYIDNAMGTMQEANDGSGKFVEVILNPEVQILEKKKLEKAKSLHRDAHKMCFIANSCNFKIKHNPIITIA